MGGGGYVIPGKLWDYVGEIADQTKAWVALLTEIQVLLGWTKIERTRTTAVKDIAEKYVTAAATKKSTITKTPSKRSKTKSLKRARVDEDDDDVIPEMPGEVDDGAF